MKKVFQKTTLKLFPPSLILSGLIAIIILPSCQKNIHEIKSEPQVAKASKSFKDFTQVNLVANNDEYGAAVVDPNLINGWGIAFSSGGTAWVSAADNGVSTVYNREGVIQGISPVKIPSPGATSGGAPSGQFFNSTTSDFKLLNGNKAAFIFAGLDGVISGWNGGAAATAMVDRNGTSVYTGLGIGNVGTDSFLYATDFKSAKVDKFNRTWVLQTASFVDPNLPAGYAPFNAQNIGGLIYVTYAQKEASGEEKKGDGLGVVNVFNPDGSFVKRLVTGGKLNAPWGVAQAPASWLKGAASSTVIVVGNFGNGHINAYDAANGTWLGTLKSNGTVITIDGLWGISFKPSGAAALNGDWLYFAAGPSNETKGVFGYVTK